MLTVRPAEVERGDFILGAPRLRVHRICLDCTIVERRAWLFHDRRGWVIARRPIASMVTVERDDAGDTSDWADPVGIVRPPSLRVVA